MSKQLIGVRYIRNRIVRTHGDRLCEPCYDRLLHKVADFYPRPGFSRPKGQIVIRARDLKTIDRTAAITLACCFGHICRAAELVDSSALRVSCASL